MRKLIWLALLALGVAACNSAEQAPTSPPPTVAPTAALENTETVAELPTTVPPSPTAVEEPPPPTNVPALEPTSEPTLAPTAPPPVEDIMVNGQYENTYYRGAETATVTMIDYSDFL